MNLIEQLTGGAAPVAQSSWIQDLVKSRYQPQQGRIKRTPVGFNFTREPFDPSSYYKNLSLVGQSSELATARAQQDAVNRQNAQLAADAAKRQDAITKALKGLTPKFTYSPNPNTGVPGGVGGVTPGGAGYSPIQKGLRNYGLKGVTPNTSAAANYFGSRYGIQSIGGYRAHGSVPGSDHPKGRGLDFMTNNFKTGTALANDAIKNYKQWGIKYVIYNRYIWNPRVGWHKYNGPSPHTDHVHVSFNK